MGDDDASLPLTAGDCHRSMVAHEDSVTAVLFQPETHYFFSAGKDGVCKYWDADRYCTTVLTTAVPPSTMRDNHAASVAD